MIRMADAGGDDPPPGRPRPDKMFYPLHGTAWSGYGVAIVAFAAVSLLDLWLRNWMGCAAFARVGQPA